MTPCKLHDGRPARSICATAYVAIGMLLVLLLTGCAEKLSPEQAATRAHWQMVEARYPDAQSIQNLLSGKTFRVFDGHGNQIEYLGADGRAFLWYPGNGRAVPSLWQIRETTPTEYYRQGLQICFLYPSSSRNGLSGEPGGKWQCQNAIYFLAGIRELVAGDLFGLRSGRLPSVLPKAPERSFRELTRRRVGPSLLSAPQSAAERNREISEKFSRDWQRRIAHLRRAFLDAPSDCGFDHSYATARPLPLTHTCLDGPYRHQVAP